MANLFVLYLPVEDVEEEEILEDPKRRESLKIEKKFLGDQKIREVVSTPDIAKMFQPFKSPNKQTNLAVHKNEENVDSEASSSEKHPLLGSGEVVGRFVKSQSNVSINKIHKKSSDISPNLQPSLTSINDKNFKDVPGSRFKISEVSADTPDGDGKVVGGEKEGREEKDMEKEEEGEDEMCQEVMTLREVFRIIILNFNIIILIILYIFFFIRK